jgi:hypothetical protein
MPRLFSHWTLALYIGGYTETRTSKEAELEHITAKERTRSG